MNEVLEFLIYTGLTSVILYLAYRLWKRADILEKFTAAEEVEQDFKKVSSFEKSFQGLPEKLNKVQEFKKQPFKEVKSESSKS